MRRFYIFILALLMAAALCGCAQESFVGSCEKSSDGYVAEFERMTGSDSHTLTLKKGDALSVHFKADTGSLRLAISCGNSVLYSGNGTVASDFTLNIPIDGEYTVSLEARSASGSVCVKRSIK